MAIRVIIAGLVGGLIIFFVGAFVHLATPVGMAGMSVFSPEKEDAVMTAMKGAVPAAGLYIFPGRDMSHNPTPDEQKAWEAKIHAGPYGMLIISPEGGEAMSPRQLLTELGSNVVAALLAATLLSTTRLSYSGRVGFLVLLALFSWVAISVSYWNWYHFPLDFTLAACLDELIGWAISGLAIAAIVRPKHSPVPEAVLAA